MLVPGALTNVNKYNFLILITYSKCGLRLINAEKVLFILSLLTRLINEPCCKVLP